MTDPPLDDLSCDGNQSEDQELDTHHADYECLPGGDEPT